MDRVGSIGSSQSANSIQHARNADQSAQQRLHRQDIGLGRSIPAQKPDPFSTPLLHVGSTVSNNNREFVAGVINKHSGEPAQSGADIPKRLSHFWAGGPMHGSTAGKLAESADDRRPGASQWSHSLMTSDKINKSFDKSKRNTNHASEQREMQFQSLQQFGFQRKNIDSLLKASPEELGLPKDTAKNFKKALEITLSAAAKGVKAGNFEDVKHLSDLVRLVEVNQNGGMYTDADMGLGNMDLTAPLKHNDGKSEVVLTGALGPVYDAKEESVNAYNHNKMRINNGQTLNPAEAGANEQAAEALVDGAATNASLMNGEIASRAENPKLVKAIDQLSKKIVELGAPVSGMQVQNSLVNGFPDYQSVPPHVLDFEHFTADSNNR